MTLSRCRVVLIRPQFPGNIGATARVMGNFGLGELVLVAPEADPLDQRARQMAARGENVLLQARRVSELGEAIGDCVMVAGTSARSGGLFRRQNVGPPEAIVPRLLESGAHGPVALVFGPEASGLTDAEVTRCHYLISIPADDGYPALNLAQAVAICLYELRRSWLASTPLLLERDAPATLAELEHMFDKLRRALQAIHFLYGPKADALMHGLRHLISRAQPTPMEVDLLRGLARQIAWCVDHSPG